MIKRLLFPLTEPARKSTMQFHKPLLVVADVLVGLDPKRARVFLVFATRRRDELQWVVGWF